jgi:hypothetical protein
LARTRGHAQHTKMKIPASSQATRKRSAGHLFGASVNCEHPVWRGMFHFERHRSGAARLGRPIETAERPAVTGTDWFDDRSFMCSVAFAPKVHPLNSPAATPWEKRKHRPTVSSAESASHFRVSRFQRSNIIGAQLPGRCPSLMSRSAFGAHPGACSTTKMKTLPRYRRQRSAGDLFVAFVNFCEYRVGCDVSLRTLLCNRQSYIHEGSSFILTFINP